MKKLVYVMLGLLFGSSVSAQYMADAYRLSNFQIQGTARSIALGNAIGAVGGDFTSLSVNPAGIGLYRTNEFTLTTSLKFANSELSLDNTKFSDKDFKLHFNQIGYVGTSKSANPNSSVVSFNYGIGYNKLADFNQSFLASKNQSGVSFLDNIVDYANGEALSNAYLQQDYYQVEYRDWPTKLAWDTYLIDPATDNTGAEIDGQYTSLLYDNEKVDQLISGERSGRINEYVFSGGLNINHRFYLGATVAVQDVLYKQELNYSEVFGDDSFIYGDNFKLTGTGVSMKLGAIFKPVQSLRLGLAWHSPTYYNMSEESALSMTSYLQESHYAQAVNNYDYDFHTPMKIVASGALVIGKFALVSADVDFVDYSAMRFKNGGGSDPMTDLNAQVTRTFTDVINYRLGGEFRVANNFSLLAGYEFYGNPVKATSATNEELPSDNLSAISVGMGYSFKNMYFDTALKYYEHKSTMYHAQPNFEEVPATQQNTNITFTLGYRF